MNLSTEGFRKLSVREFQNNLRNNQSLFKCNGFSVWNLIVFVSLIKNMVTQEFQKKIYEFSAYHLTISFIYKSLTRQLQTFRSKNLSVCSLHQKFESTNFSSFANNVEAFRNSSLHSLTDTRIISSARALIECIQLVMNVSTKAYHFCSKDLKARSP